MHRPLMFGSALVWTLVAAPAVISQAATPIKSMFSVQPTVAEISNAKIFEEPLIPFGNPKPEDSAALGKALDAYVAAGDLENFQPLTEYLKANPESPWKPSLCLGLGLMYRHTGYLTLALDSWEEAWRLSKSAKDPRQVGIAHRALGELAEINAGLGRMSRIEELLKESENRVLSGLVTEKLAGAKESLALMKVAPDRTFRCGPMALAHIKALEDPRALGDPKLLALQTTKDGTSLEMNLRWAGENGLKMQMAKRTIGESVVVPAMLHWKAGHFAAIVRENDGHYLLQDPNLGDTWISREVLDEEGTGYALIPAGPLPKGWTAVSGTEGAKIWGRGAWGPGRPDDTRPESPKVPPLCQEGPGMPYFAFHTNVVSLNIVDTPVGYAPPRGMRVDFTVTYNQREYGQPQVFDYSNLGPKWTFNWLACLKDDTTKPSGNIIMCSPGGGGLIFKAIGNWQYEPENFTQARLTRLSPTAYMVQYQDGRQDHFTIPDRASGLRRVVLTKVVDKTGNAVNLTWDAQLRMVGITDPLGKTTTISYELAGDPLKITKVTDPFGRCAHFEYNANGYLSKITDAVGLNSTFTYGPTSECPTAPADFVNSLTTPYGTNKFAMGENGTYGVRWLESENPLGQRDRLEAGSTYSGVMPVEPIPGIPELNPSYLNPRFGFRLSLYWDRRAYANRIVDYSKTHIYQWGHGAGGYASGILVSEKKPLENRTWYVHTGTFWGGIAPTAAAKAVAPATVLALQQKSGLECGTEAPTRTAPRLLKASRALEVAMAPSAVTYMTPMFEGSRALVTRTARLLDDGSVQLNVSDRDLAGNLARTIDPMGRTTNYSYSSDGLELLETRSAANELLAKTTYNALHLPLTSTGSDGKTTTYTYNTLGQVTSLTNPKGEATTMAYDAQGFLKSITGAQVGSTTSFAYDAVGRVRTVTGPDNATVTTDYDNLDRPTKVTYSDGTTEELVYDKLDLVRKKDRKSQWTIMLYNPLRQLIEVQDPQGRTTQFDWCGCGGQLESLKDPMGRITNWWRDLQGRVIGKRLHDGSQTNYAYDSVGRLIQRVDAKGQKTLYQYDLDNNLAQVSYLDSLKPTPSANYTYDPEFNRLATSKGAFGTTTYTYYPISATPVLGAGRLASVQGPFANSKITYTYDELGRAAVRDINGTKETRAFDSLGRVGTMTNPLGAFHYGYQGATGRLDHINLPNGQISSFSYFDATQSNRLKGIKHAKSTGAVISSFEYTYDANGQIKTWSQQADAVQPNVHTFQYDAANQLTSAVLHGPTGALIHQYVYGYDLAGNRTSEQIDGNVTTADYNNTNQLTTQRKSSVNAAKVVTAPKPSTTAKPVVIPAP